MLDSPVVELLIGMIFLYSLMSILVTQVNSVISNALNLRAQHLRDGLADLIQDPVIRAKFVSHPLVQLAKDTELLPTDQITEAEARAIVDAALSKVTWISPKIFADVIVDLVETQANPQVFNRLTDVVNTMPQGEARTRLLAQINQILKTGVGIEELRRLISRLRDEQYRFELNRIMAQIDEETIFLRKASDDTTALLLGLQNIDNPYFKQAITTLVTTSNSLDATKEKMEKWFDEGMQRATNAFKQKMQLYSLISGLVIAVVLNVDTLFVMQTLWNDNALRSALSVAAINTDLDELRELVTETTDEEIAAAAAAEAEASAQGLGSIFDATTQAGDTFDDLLQLRLPLGWRMQDPNIGYDTQPLIPRERNLWYLLPANNPSITSWLGLLLLKISGILATTIAIAQGAPFWFGILRRLSGGTSSA